MGVNRRRVAAVLLLAGLAVLAGCSGPSADAGPSGDEPLHADAAPLTERWLSDTGRDIGGNHHAVAAGRVGAEGIVVAPISGRGGTDDCALVALDAADGSQRWTYPIPVANCTIHAVADPVLADLVGDDTPEVIAATTEREVIAADARTGEVRARYPLSSYGYTKPIVANVTGDAAPELVAVDARGTVVVRHRNGTPIWTSRGTTYTWGQPAVADLDGDGRTELLVARSDRLTAFAARTGRVVWKRTPPGQGSVTWTTTGDADGDGAAEVALATAGGTVAVVDGETGQPVWTRDLGDFAAVRALGDGDADGTAELYAVASDGRLRALDAANGTVEWTARLTATDVQMMPPPSLGDVDGDGVPDLVAATNDGWILVLDPGSGGVRVASRRDASVYTHPTLADTDDDGRDEVYLQFGDGRVGAYALE